MTASFVGTLYVNIPPFIFFCSFNLIFESKAMRPCLSWSPSSNQVTKFWAYKLVYVLVPLVSIIEANILKFVSSLYVTFSCNL